MSSEGSTESTSTAQPSTPNGAIDSYYEAGDIDHGLDPFIRRATQDLAERLSVPPAEIATVAAVLVVWPDSSSGCPEPGGSYLTALQDGSVIELIAADRVYRYHSGGASGPSLCDQPLSSDPLSSDPLSSDPAAAG
jgi:hypothetical protein